MSFCPKCGKGLPVEAVFCPSCGSSLEENTIDETDYTSQEACPPVAPQQYSDNGAARRQQLLDNFYLRLKWERTAWTIAGTVCTIIGAVMAGICLLTLFVGLVNVSNELVSMLGLSYFCFIYALVFLPIGIVSLILKSKVTKYMDGLYFDCGPAITRGDSIGMLIFNYLFNTVALVFYLINFITIKMHREEFEEIRRLQLAAINNNTYNQ